MRIIKKYSKNILKKLKIACCKSAMDLIIYRQFVSTQKKRVLTKKEFKGDGLLRTLSSIGGQNHEISTFR